MEWLILFDSQLGLPLVKVVILNQNFPQMIYENNNNNKMKK